MSRADTLRGRGRGRRTGLTWGLSTAAVVGVTLILAPSAFADFLTPKSGGSPNANEIHSLYKLVLYVAIVVFLIVEGALVYSMYKFRAKRGAVAAQIHGNTRLEIGWTVAAAAILVILTVITFIKLPSIVDPPNSDANGLVLSASTTQPNPPNGKKLMVCVTGRQYIWRYTYGADCLNKAFTGKLPYSYEQMWAPANTTVVLAVQASDVIHSWWIPSLGGKVDAVPGYTSYTWFKAVGPALYHGQCAELCGRGHAAMGALVKVVSPSDFQSWLQRQRQLINAQNAQVSQLRQILTANGNL